MLLNSVYIIAARRSALGRLGGLHRDRRLADIAGPVIAAVLRDAGVNASDVQQLILGNSSEAGHPARVLALSAGLSDAASAYRVDWQCASGLAAVVAGTQAIATGTAEVVVAGGAESLSTAPWRVAKPSRQAQLPRFVGVSTDDLEDQLEMEEEAARALGVSRSALDLFAARAHLQADAAREAKRFLNEIVPLRSNADEVRDEVAQGFTLEDLEAASPFLPPDGVMTSANVSAMADGAAFVLLVNEARWTALGKPAALRFAGHVLRAVAPDDVAGATSAAFQDLGKVMQRVLSEDVAIEMNERSALEALAFLASTGVDERALNIDGGAVARGLPLGASSAVSLVRLFSRFVRHGEMRGSALGVVVQSTQDGQALAAAFEQVSAR